jgi:hypothetical protein
MAIIARLRGFAKSIAMVVHRLIEQLQREIDEERRNPPLEHA